MTNKDPLLVQLAMAPAITELLQKRLTELISLHLEGNGFLGTLKEKQQTHLLSKLRGTFDALQLDVGTLIEQALRLHEEKTS